MSEEKLVPKLRFSGFDDEWNQYYLKDVIQDFINGQTPSRNVDSFWNGDVNWVSSGELNYNYITSTIEQITAEGKNNANLKLLSPGTFLIAITGLEAPGTRGSCAILGIEATTNQSCMALLPKEDKIITKFLYYWYLKVGETYGVKYTQGTKQQSYNKELLEKLPITIPDIREQNKISEFLSVLNHKIELLEQKYQYYQEFKKYLMQQIFTQKLRFVDFNNSSWKDYKFKDLGTVKSGVGFSNKYQGHLDLDYNFYKVSDMNLKGNEKVMTRSNNTIDDNLLKDIGVKLIENPSIIFAKVGEAIFLNRKRIAKQPFLIDNNMMAFSPNENVDLEFMYYLATSINFGKYAQTGALPSYNASDIYSIKCKIPPIEEQKRIGKLLSLADNKIDFCSNQLNKTQEFKKGLLQQMFVVQLILSLLQNKKHI